MYKVRNQKVVRRLSFRSFTASRTRNMVAILAIALTTILFTTLFTVIISLNYTSQQQTMRMVGGYSHGRFKYLTFEQVEQLSKHPLVKEFGYSVMLAMPDKEPFTKRQVEMRYGTDTAAKMYFCNPTTGRMPREKKEIAMDTAVLDMLGVPYKVGEEITLPYTFEGKAVVDTFTLSGYWESDPVARASEVWLSKEYVLEKLDGYNPSLDNNMFGTWSLDMMFANSKHIEKSLQTIAQDNGYTIDESSTDNFLDYGVNWAYTSTHYENGEQMKMTIALIAGLGFIIFVGYLIIYNIFGISVMNDMHFYGLLKTIGTTKRQIKRIIRYQGLMLSVIGIPIGLCFGYVLGNSFVKIMVSSLSNKTTYVTFNSWIFIGSSFFALLTVMISCSKPGKMAAKVSPIEAVRYSEGSQNSNKRMKKEKKGKHGARIYRMAIANVRRNKGKTTLVIVSLTLSLVLFNTIFSFTKGFSMDRLLDRFVISDYLLGSAKYFQANLRSDDDGVSESFIEEVESKGYTTRSGRIYQSNGIAQARFTQDELVEYCARWGGSEYVEYIKSLFASGDNEMFWYIDIYGLENYPLEKMTLVEGDVSKIEDSDMKGIIQIVGEDDYGNPETETIIKNVGEKLIIHYVDELDNDADNSLIEKRSNDVEYTIVATMMMPNAMSTRSYGSPQFALPSNSYLKDAGNSTTMAFMLDIDDTKIKEMEEFISSYTKNVEKDMDYESKKYMEEEFSNYKNMFLLVGGGVTVVITIIGILNFVNTMITSIQTRKREFAVLQSIGMTGKQLRMMVMIEGLFYTGAALIVACIIGSIVNVVVLQSFESMLWFYQYEYSIGAIVALAPVFILLGVGLPAIVYKSMVRKSLVERMRTTD